MEPLDASAGLRERLARLKVASKRRAARAGGVGVSDEPTDENRFVPSETRSKPIALTEDVRAAPATSSRDRLEALRASRSAARSAAGEGAADGTRPPADRPPRAFAASTERRSDTTSGHRKEKKVDALRADADADDADDADAASASEPPLATVAILRAVSADAQIAGNDHVDIGTFAAVSRTRDGVEFVTTRPKTTIRKTRRFAAVADVRLLKTNANDSSGVFSDGFLSEDASSSVAAKKLASDEGGFGLARDARAAVRDGVGSAFVFFGNRASVSRVARGSSSRPRGRRPGEDGVPGDDLGFTGLIAEALFREIDLARAETPGVEFVVTLQVLADVIVAPRGAETSKPGGANGNAKTREVLRDALAEGFDDMHATRDSDALTASFRGGRGAGAASAAAAYFRADASRPVIPRVREDPDAKLFFAEGAVEAVCETLETCRACLALAFSKLARWEAEMRANSKTFSGERAHSLARFDVRARRFAEDGDENTEAAADDFLVARTKNTDVPISETRASVHVCDLAGSRPRFSTKDSLTKKNGTNPKSRRETVPEDAAKKAFFRVADAVLNGASHVPLRDSNVTKLLADALRGDSRLRCVFGARDGVFSNDALAINGAFEDLDATLTRAETVANAFDAKRSKTKRRRVRRRVTRARDEMANAERAARELCVAALGDADAMASGLRSTDIELDMHGSDALVALRDALARLERMRTEAARVAETREATERLFSRFGFL